MGGDGVRVGISGVIVVSGACSSGDLRKSLLWLTVWFELKRRFEQKKNQQVHEGFIEREGGREGASRAGLGVGHHARMPKLCRCDILIKKTVNNAF